MPSLTASATSPKVEKLHWADLSPGIGDADDWLVQVFPWRSRCRRKYGSEPQRRGSGLRSGGCCFAWDCAFHWSRYCSSSICISGCYVFLATSSGLGSSQKALSCLRSNASSVSAWRRVRPMSSRPSSRQYRRNGSIVEELVAKPSQLSSIVLSSRDTLNFSKLVDGTLTLRVVFSTCSSGREMSLGFRSCRCVRVEDIGKAWVR